MVDATCVVDLLFNDRRSLEVLEVISGMSLAAPAHIDLDVVSLLARVDPSEVPGDDVPASDLGMRAEAYLRMPMKRYDIAPLMLKAWGHHPSLPVKDALYVSLADHLEVPLVTRSRAMAAACSQATLVQTMRGWGGADVNQDFLSE